MAHADLFYGLLLLFGISSLSCGARPKITDSCCPLWKVKYMFGNRLLAKVAGVFARSSNLPQRSSSTNEHAGHAWQGAQKYEREFWIRYIRDELNITTRDQAVGFRLCEGRVHLCQFGLLWDNWMYSRDLPLISGKLLDVGSSLVSVFEKCRSVSVVAIDPSLETLAQNLPELVVLGKVNNCDYRCCRIQEVEKTDFDIIWCNNVLDHTDDWQDIIRHFRRVIKKSGQLFLGTDVRGSGGLLDAGHISAFTADEVVSEVVSNGFEVIWQTPPVDLPQYRFSLRAVKQ